MLTFTLTKPSLVIHARASEAIKAAIDAINLANVFISQRFNHTAPRYWNGNRRGSSAPQMHAA
jgi:hypothetical protein